MREITLKRFFLDEVNADVLAEDVCGSVARLDAVASSVQIEDMQEPFQLQREHVIRLSDAASSRTLPPESLSAIAFALMASDAFWWDDYVIAEVVADWSCPEINYPLTDETLAMHRNWLEGKSEPPIRSLPPRDKRQGRIVSTRTKERIPKSV